MEDLRASQLASWPTPSGRIIGDRRPWRFALVAFSDARLPWFSFRQVAVHAGQCV
jgi:hypothetical protein